MQALRQRRILRGHCSLLSPPKQKRTRQFFSACKEGYAQALRNSPSLRLCFSSLNATSSLLRRVRRITGERECCHETHFIAPRIRVAGDNFMLRTSIPSRPFCSPCPFRFELHVPLAVFSFFGLCSLQLRLCFSPVRMSECGDTRCGVSRKERCPIPVSRRPCLSSASTGTNNRVRTSCAAAETNAILCRGVLWTMKVTAYLI